MAKQITTINPATEEVINTYEMMTKEQINKKAKKAREFLFRVENRYTEKSRHS